MICVGELKEWCESIENEYGSDTPVVVEVKADGTTDGIIGAYALTLWHIDNGTLFIKGFRNDGTVNFKDPYFENFDMPELMEVE